MIARTIGRRYAKALMAVTTARSEKPEDLLAELEAVAGALAGEPRFGELMVNPKVLLAARLASLGRFLDALQPRPMARHFFEMLLSKGRLGALPEIVDEFRTLADERAGIVRAAVTSAAPLAAGDTEQLRATLGARFGKTVVLTSAIDPGLIGGLVVRIGSLSFDGSIRSQLAAIHRQLLEEVTFS
ncbi:MAG: ATP synthase F1 subunit delta [Candidatus Methylomirabilia bacterium]